MNCTSKIANYTPAITEKKTKVNAAVEELLKNFDLRSLVIVKWGSGNKEIAGR